MEVGTPTSSVAYTLLWIAGVSAGVLVLFRWYVGRFTGNVRTVARDYVYRSGQLSGPRLARVLSAFGIQSVLNLRGALPGDLALAEERRLCRERGIEHLDLWLDPQELPPPAVVWELLDALDRLPRPILLHCAAGSDRAGLAAALYLHVHRGLPLARARAAQLTWRYGHWPGARARAMDRFLDLYRDTGSDMSVWEWLLEVYPRVYAAEGPPLAREPVSSATAGKRRDRAA